MKQIRAHIAVSLDGFIATQDNELDWMPENVRTLLNKEYQAAPVLLMGRIPTTIFLNIGEGGHTKANSLL